MNKHSPTLLAIEKLRERMGAKKRDWVANPVKKFEEKLEAGIEIRGLGELERAEEDNLIAIVGPDGKFRQCLVYIPYGEDFKVHIAWCETLEKKRQWGDFEIRYVATRRTNGRFKIWLSQTRTDEVTLGVCKNCLRKINWDGYKYYVWKRGKIFRDFDFHKLLEKYKPDFDKIPPRKDTDPPNDYTDDWDKISTKYKDARKWTCENESCRVKLQNQEHKKYLHCHHINRRRNDNRWENLQALCILCHAEKHSHMSQHPEGRVVIERLRHEQGL